MTVTISDAYHEYSRVRFCYLSLGGLVSERFSDLVVRYAAVGSRITVRPPPTDTDEDFLVLLHPGTMSEFSQSVTGNGWVLGGSMFNEERQNPDHLFRCFKRNDVDLLCTESKKFFDGFLVATYLAQRLNVTDKGDRKALFEAVQFGRAVGQINVPGDGSIPELRRSTSEPATPSRP